MSDTPRMDSAFNQPTSTTPERNWQRDQCSREGSKLERELATATEQRDRLAEALRKIDMARLDDFMGPHDMALKCVSIARESLAAVPLGAGRCTEREVTSER